MEEDFFDVAIEGTTLNDCNFPNDLSRKIVIDTANNYGTTYSGIDKLKSSPYITDLIITKSVPNNIIVEALPFIIRPSNPVVQKYSAKPFGSHLEYVDVNDIYFVDCNGLSAKLPNTMTDIVECNFLDNIDRIHLSAAITSNDIVSLKRHIIRNYLEDDMRYKIFVKYHIYSKDLVARFSSTLFIYPVYGLSELSENISLLNSLNGFSYLLNNQIQKTEINDKGEYKYKFVCEYGTLYAKTCIEQKLKQKTAYVRMLHTKEARCRGNFVAYLEAEELIKIIGLDSKSHTCSDGMQVLYFIKDHSPVSQRNIESFGVGHDDIVADLAYKTKYDIEQFDNVVVI